MSRSTSRARAHVCAVELLGGGARDAGPRASCIARQHKRRRLDGEARARIAHGGQRGRVDGRGLHALKRITDALDRGRFRGLA